MDANQDVFVREARLGMGSTWATVFFGATRFSFFLESATAEAEACEDEDEFCLLEGLSDLVIVVVVSLFLFSSKKWAFFLVWLALWGVAVSLGLVRCGRKLVDES